MLYATTDEAVRVSSDEGETFELKKFPHEPDDLVARNGVVYVSFREPALLSVDDFGWAEALDDDAVVRARWARLRERLLASAPSSPRERKVPRRLRMVAVKMPIDE